MDEILSQIDIIEGKLEAIEVRLNTLETFKNNKEKQQISLPVDPTSKKILQDITA